MQWQFVPRLADFECIDGALEFPVDATLAGIVDWSMGVEIAHATMLYEEHFHFGFPHQRSASNGSRAVTVR